MSVSITLTTDFGTRDGFAAQMKGVILGINPSAILIDVTHEVEAFSVLEAALVLKGLLPYVPAGTVHLAVVDPGVGSPRRGITIRSRDQLFVGPDNGLFSLVFRDDKSCEIREISNQKYARPEAHPTFHGRDVFAPVAAHLSLGTALSDLGSLVHDPCVLSLPQVKRAQGGLEGQVIHVDRFGNAMSNIEAAMLDKEVAWVRIGRHHIRGISRFFGQVEAGRPLALINSFGYLEIAVHRGDAASELQIVRGDVVEVMWDLSERP